MAKWEQVPGAINPLFLSTPIQPKKVFSREVMLCKLQRWEYQLVHICRPVVIICGFRGLVNRITQTNMFGPTHTPFSILSPPGAMYLAHLRRQWNLGVGSVPEVKCHI